MEKVKKDIKLRCKVVLILSSVFLFLLLPEVIFRITDTKWRVDSVYGRFLIFMDEEKKYVQIPLDMKDPYLLWRTSKSFEFRGIKYNINKNTNTVRIVCLGDSCTQGFIKEGAYYMERKETYPSCLQKLLNRHYKESGKHFEVMNAGIGGYSSLQGLRYFKKELIKYNPDIVTFYFGINDRSSCIILSDAEQKIFPQWIVNLHNIFMKSKLYQLIMYYQKRKTLEQWERKKSSHNKRFRKLFYRVSEENYKCNIEMLYKITKEKGIKLVLINYPTDSQNEFVTHNKVLKETAVQYKISLVDIVKVAEEYKNNENKIFIDMCHPTPYFNKIIAKEIYKILVLNKYI